MEGLSRRKIEIPESVVMEILLKLPVKSLLRFRCVCKAWFSSLQTPQFIAEHRENSLLSNNLNLLFKLCDYFPPGRVYFSALSVQQGENYFVSENIHLPFYYDCYSTGGVYGPSDGLLCLHNDDQVALWNPSTREFNVLPPSTYRRPLVSLFNRLGFGFDSRNGDYKVVRFAIYYLELNSRIHQVELYSVKSNSWKELSIPQSFPCEFHSPLFGYDVDGIYNDVNGFYYWPAVGYPDYHILCFDMAKEEFSVLFLPKINGSLKQSWLKLLGFNGSLGVIVYPRYGVHKSIDLWVRNDSWTKQFSIVISGVDRPLGFWENGKMFFEGSSHELLLFDPVTGQLKNLGIHSRAGSMQLIAYVESLVPINGRSEQKEGIIRRLDAEKQEKDGEEDYGKSNRKKRRKKKQ